MKQGSISFVGNSGNGRPIAGAQNGNSINAAGFVVLGNNIGEAGNPAAFSSTREINVINNTNTLQMIDGLGNIVTLSNAQFTTWWGLKIIGNTKLPVIQLQNLNAATWKEWRIDISTTNGGEFGISDTTGSIMRLSRLLGSFSSPMFMFQNVLDFTVNTGIVVTAIRPRAVLTNRGAPGIITFTLPSATAILWPEYTFNVVAGFAVTIQAPAGVTIRVGAVVSPAGGTITGAAVGSSVRLQQLNATEWQAIAVVGAWVTP
jgi:hypothetical protein